MKKTQKQWLSELPYPLNELALNRFKPSEIEKSLDDEYQSLEESIYAICEWDKTPEGFNFWMYVKDNNKAPEGWIVTPERAYKEDELTTILKEGNEKLNKSILEQYERFVNIFTNAELKGIIQTNKTDNTMTTPPNTRPFNLQDFLAGKPIVNQNRDNVDAIWFEKADKLVFINPFTNLICIFTIEQAAEYFFHPCEQKEGWGIKEVIEKFVKTENEKTPNTEYVKITWQE